jgi:hypothetical protein
MKTVTVTAVTVTPVPGTMIRVPGRPGPEIQAESRARRAAGTDPSSRESEPEYR